VEEAGSLEDPDVHRRGRRGQIEILGYLGQGDHAVPEVLEDRHARLVGKRLEERDGRSVRRSGIHHQRLPGRQDALEVRLPPDGDRQAHARHGTRRQLLEE
jgi:hypothetical protein